MIGDFRITLHRALDERLTLLTLGDKLPYHDPTGKERTIEPDWAFTLLEGNDRLDFFLEADRSTMPNTDYLAKLRAYWLYWTQKRDAFRVLTVCKSEARTRNLRSIARHAYDEPTGAAMFWFTSAERYSIEAPSQLFDPIWQTPADEEPHHLLE
jgi:hypothetical protein